MGALLDASRFAWRIHRGQVDKAGAPYYDHVCAVVRLLDTTDLGPEAARIAEIAAWLHDTIEDSEDTLATRRQIRDLFGQRVLDVVNRLTREGEFYRSDYIPSLAESPIARRVKIADLTHNLMPGRATLSPSLRERYQWALDYLRSRDTM
jgi:(p)ppGpp synthase/HD superfamily hydrolase